MIYLDKIREKESAAYTVGAYASFSRLDERTNVSLMAYCPMKPEKADIALDCMRSEMEGLTKTCDADMLTKVKEYMLKNFDDRTKTNSYWQGIVDDYCNYGVDFYTGYKKTVEAQTPESVSAFVAEVLKQGNRIEVVMLPE